MSENQSESVSTYQQYLPAILQKDVFVGQFLLAFEKILSGLNETPSQEKIIRATTQNPPGLTEIIDNIDLYFNPQETPEEFLPWLAGWVALSLRDDWKPDAKSNQSSSIYTLLEKEFHLQAVPPEEILQICRKNKAGKIIEGKTIPTIIGTATKSFT